MNTRIFFAFSVFLLLASALAVRSTAQSPLTRNPVLPTINGTYYYVGYDEVNDRYVYTSGTSPDTSSYYYVDSSGNTTAGAATESYEHSAYRVVINGTFSNFQLYNNHPDLYRSATITGTDGSVSTGTDFFVRSGSWSASNITFLLTNTNASGIWLEGVSGAVSATSALAGSGTFAAYPNGTVRALYYPVSFTGTNVNVLVETGAAGSLQAVSLRNGATAAIYSGTISKKVTTSDTTSSEAIYLVGNQESLGTSSHFYGEDLTIVAEGANIRAVTMGAGNNTFTIKNSTITSITGKNNSSEAIYLADTQGRGGNHFRGQNIIITNNSGRGMAFGDGANTFTLISSTMINAGVGAAIAWNATTSSSGDKVESAVYLRDTLVATSGSYSPIFQQVGDRARLTVIGGTLAATGTNSSILRLVAQNDNSDSTRMNASFTNVILDAPNGVGIDVNIDASYNIYGNQVGGGGKNIGTAVEDTFNILFQSSTLNAGMAAIRLAAAGSGTSTYTEHTNLFVYDSTFAGGIQMLAGGYNAFTSGANLILTASNAIFSGGMYVTGSSNARRDNQGILYVYDSEWTGNIELVERGNLTFQFKNTPIDGALSLTGSSHVQLRLTNSPIIEGITTEGTARVTGFALGSGQVGAIEAKGGLIELDLENVPSGGITASGNGRVGLKIGNEVTIPAGITLSDNARVDIALRDAIEFTGDINVTGRAMFALHSSNPSVATTLHGNVDLGGIWYVPSKVTLQGTLALTGSLGTIAFSGAALDSLILTQGISGKGRIDIQAIAGTELKDPEIRLIKDETGTFASDTFILSHPVDYRLTAYLLENRPDGAWLVGGLEYGSFGSGGAAVFNSQSLVAEDWFAALAPLTAHLGDLRRINDDIFSGGAGAPSRAQGDAGVLWLQTRFDTTNVDLAGPSLDFKSRVLGLTVGADARWDHDTSVVSTGIFLDSSRTDRDFDGSADGSTIAAGGGLYLSYHHRGGFFTSAIARFDTYKTMLDTHDPNNPMNARYNTQAFGLELELGWRFNLGTGWWFEPAYHLALVSLPGITYATKSTIDGNKIDIEIADGRATQNMFRFAMGKALNDKWSVRGHLAVSGISASGGEFTSIGINDAKFMLKEDRLEASIGISRQIGRAGRITLDASYTEADSYERPCSIALGFSHLW